MMAFLIRYLAALAPMHEFNLDTLACGAGPLAVRVRFIRNEALALSGKGTTAAKRAVFALMTARTPRRTPVEAAPPSPPVLPPTPPAPPLPRPYLMCEWAEAAAEADLMVLNRGMHFVPDGLITQQLHATFSTLHALRRAARTELVHVHEVVYRSTHASIPSCHLLEDPLPRPFPYLARDNVSAAYHWADFERQNQVAHSVAASHEVTFLHVHPATLTRPGGHMPPRRGAHGDCAHYCLPGPIDEWVRSLLALWT
jgi:hypothetical protein